MQRSDFHYHLPEELIAQDPTEERTESRLLVLDGPTGEIQHCRFKEIVSLLEPHDLLVFNDTRVIPARLFGQKQTGGKIELMLERIIDEQNAWVHIRASKSPQEGAVLEIEEAFQVKVITRQDDLFKIEFLDHRSAVELFETYGHMPLPPYIKRQDNEQDAERYQTVYGCKKGAVAAPTAGLHFDLPLLDEIKAKSIATAFVTLHVGAGTFQSLRVDDIRQHKMHSEYIEVSAEVCEQINEVKQKGRRVIAVGTTTVRSLETAAQSGSLQPYFGETDIFIYPGYQFQIIDSLITNFHLPESTLIMLVSAFAGYDETMAAYKAAVENKYRFFSYGDAMFINKRTV